MTCTYFNKQNAQVFFVLNNQLAYNANITSTLLTYQTTHQIKLMSLKTRVNITNIIIFLSASTYQQQIFIGAQRATLKLNSQSFIK